MIKWKMENSLNFAHNLRVGITQSNFSSSQHSKSQLTPCYVRGFSWLAEYFLSSSGTANFKLALKFFRKYHYYLILREIWIVQRFFNLSSITRNNLLSFLGSLSCKWTLFTTDKSWFKKDCKLKIYLHYDIFCLD